MQFLRNLLRPEKTSAPTPSTPPQPVVLSAPCRIRVGWATDVGEVRRHNEDTALVVMAAQNGDNSPPEFGLFVLADGMGGHQAGEVASSLAARTVAYHVLRHLYLPSLIDWGGGGGQPVLNEILIEAVRAANRAVAKSVPGGGTTLTCALMLGPRAYIGHVGDSRAYVITEEGLDQITHDHSLVDRLVELGQLTRDEAATHPQKNVLYRAVGQSGALEVDTHIRTILHGERLLLCSDGLWSMLSATEMINIVTTAPSPQAACESLIAAANEAGGPDNITIILVEPPSD